MDDRKVANRALDAISEWIFTNPKLARRIHLAKLQKQFAAQIAQGKQPTLGGFDVNAPENSRETMLRELGQHIQRINPDGAES